MLTYFDRLGASNGLTETINGRLEHLRRSALGFRNPHQLHRQITPENRRIQTTTTPWILKSLFTFRQRAKACPADPLVCTIPASPNSLLVTGSPPRAHQEDLIDGGKDNNCK
jgi:hypothetical protein